MIPRNDFTALASAAAAVNADMPTFYHIYVDGVFQEECADFDAADTAYVDTRDTFPDALVVAMEVHPATPHQAPMSEDVSAQIDARVRQRIGGGEYPSWLEDNRDEGDDYAALAANGNGGAGDELRSNHRRLDRRSSYCLDRA